MEAPVVPEGTSLKTKQNKTLTVSILKETNEVV